MTRNVLVTGATGYIAKHIVRKLLDQGENVVGSARNPERDTEMRAALAPALADKAALDRYRTVSLDLSSDEGWDAAMDGVDVLMHTASPFPLEQPKDASEVIRPAVDGVTRAMTAAQKAGVQNVVLTSSTVSVTYTASNKATYTEDDWTDPNRPKLSPYAQSKALAERAAWDFVRDNAPQTRLAVINPSFVQGPPLDENYGTSLRVIDRILDGKDPALPRLGFGCCDVQDVADAHVRAMDRPDAAGKRHIIYDRFMWFADMAHLIKDGVPGSKGTTRVAPDLLVKFLGLFDPAIRGIIPDLGRETQMDNARMRNVLGIEPRDTRTSVVETAQWIMQRRANAS